MAREKLSGFTKTIQAKFGTRTIGRGDVVTSKNRRVTTGAFGLDWAMGGGWKIGGIHLFYGEKSAGKTTSAIRGLGWAQRHCRNCFRIANQDRWEVRLDGNPLMSKDGEITVLTRVDAHKLLTEANGATWDGGTSYVGKSGEQWSLHLIPGFPEAISPSEKELEEDPNARWSSRGWCDCFGTEWQPEPPPKMSGEKPKEYQARLEEWSLSMKINSYDELVVAWVDLENQFDGEWAESLGLDTKRLVFVRPESAEEAIDILHALAATHEVDFIAIDSIAQLTPDKEMEESAEKWQQGLQARLVNKSFRKMVSESAKAANADRPLTQVWLNQTRQAIGVMFGDPTTKPGGKGQDFAAHIEIRFKKGKVETVKVQYGDKTEFNLIPIEEEFDFVTTKNRTCGTKGVASFYRQLVRERDGKPPGTVLDEEYIYKLAMLYLVQQEKGEYRIADQKFTSQKALKTALNDDPALFRAVRKTLMHVLLKDAAAVAGGKATEASSE